ncbi:MAG TPA: glucosamine-6-phosphate deaminase [Cellulomonas sp.]
MDVVVCPDPDAFAATAADVVVRALAARGAPTLGLATGSSPLPLYRELGRRVAGGVLDLAAVRAFALDEYVGLPAGHPQSYREVIRRDAAEPLGLDPALVRVPDGSAPTLEQLTARAAAFDAAIVAAGGIDIQVLGIGSDGHIGFNEPMSSLSSRTRVARLAPRTRQDNARFFRSVEEVPRLCVTQGIGTILEARHLLLLAQGPGKAEAVASALEGPLTASVPASALQLHAEVTVVLDEAAAGGLRRRELYAGPITL